MFPFRSYSFVTSLSCLDFVFVLCSCSCSCGFGRHDNDTLGVAILLRLVDISLSPEDDAWWRLRKIWVSTHCHLQSALPFFQSGVRCFQLYRLLAAIQLGGPDLRLRDEYEWAWDLVVIEAALQWKSPIGVVPLAATAILDRRLQCQFS